MTWNNQSVTQLIVEEETQGVSGFFGYSPNVGSGNLAFSETASGGTDNYGNQYPTGQASTNLPAVWYGKGNATPTVVQTATMNSTGNTVTGTFANPVTSGNTVIAAVSVWGGSANTNFSNAKFNNVAMTVAANNHDLGNGYVTNGIFYLADVTTGGTAFTATYPNVATESPFSGMVEVAGLGTAPALITSVEQGSGKDIASGSLAPQGGSTGFYMATYNYDNNGTGTSTGFTETNSNGAYYLAGSGSQEFTASLSQSAIIWLATLAVFSNTGGMQTTNVQASVSPVNTRDSVTGSGVPLGFTSDLFNVLSCGTSVTDLPVANVGCCNIFYVANSAGTGGTLYANGLSGTSIIIGTT